MKKIIKRILKRVFIKSKIAAKTFIRRLFITMQLYGDNGLANHSAAGAYGFMLSVAPMFLLIAFFILAAFQSAPHFITGLFANISFLELIIDEQWLTENLLTLSRPGFSGIISVLCILWAGRILALSMQRGLKIIFKGTKTRNPVKDALITLTLEFAVLLFVIMLVFGSQTALFIYKTFDFIPYIYELFFTLMDIFSFVYPIIILGFISFFAYLFTPVNSPRKLSALRGALFCALCYGATSILLGVILNQASYNFLYGTLGNVVFMLVNVYFFFIFFFTGAQYAFVIDSFDALLFIRLRQSRITAMENKSKSKQQFNRFDFINKLFYSAEGKLKKYAHTYKKGETLFLQGDSGNDIYYILEGEVEVIIYTSGDSGNSAGSANNESAEQSFPRILSVYKPCSFFGEMGYILSEKRSATTVAKTDVSALVLPPSLFEKILTFDTSLDRELIENITRRLKNTNDRLTGKTW